jgi:hypothetical protein
MRTIDLQTEIACVPTRHLNGHSSRENAGTDEELFARGIAHGESYMVEATDIPDGRDTMHQFLKGMEQGCAGDLAYPF